MATNTETLFSEARKHIGYAPGRRQPTKFGRWYRDTIARDGQSYWVAAAWCQMFVSYVAYVTGNRDVIPMTASCGSCTSWFKSRGRFGSTPRVGALVMFGAGGGDHVGFVESFTAKTITTIEGNTNPAGNIASGMGCYRKTHSRSSSWIHGYCYPNYSGTSGIPPVVPSTGGVVTVDGLRYGSGAKGAHITELGHLLVRAGCGRYKQGPGPSWGEADRASYEAWQRKCGFSGRDADGIPGPTTLRKLKATYGAKARVHTVVRGDTLGGIAKRYGLTLAQLLARNPGIKNANVITIGQKVSV
ncbi:peptidoglycan-binding protein [Streptomyces sp. NPDC001941]|uniref:peptidoglycan-binding protein n=1 Tax=Streptomyces sp. NPDC001941 TaxID=3154659 RepID=UPI00331EEDAA